MPRPTKSKTSTKTRKGTKTKNRRYTGEQIIEYVVMIVLAIALSIGFYVKLVATP